MRSRRVVYRLPIVLLLLAGCDSKPSNWIGYCAEGCRVDSDCCPPNEPGCPGDYPLNYKCESGLCRAPLCGSDSDCGKLEIGSSSIPLVCRAVNGFVGCVINCSADQDCVSGGFGTQLTCSSHADDNVTRVCGLVPGTTSTIDVSKLAPCQNSLHRRASGACGCDTDQECKNLGDAKCVNDRDVVLPGLPASGT